MVYGTAPKVITTKDESLMKCPFDTEFHEDPREDDPYFDPDEPNMKIHEVAKPPPQGVEEFAVAKPDAIFSKFDKEKENNSKQEVEMKVKANNSIDDDQPDLTPTDEYDLKKSRKHAWVMVLKGNREVSKSCFLEPTTGRKYEIEKSPYFQVECVFNH